MCSGACGQIVEVGLRCGGGARRGLSDQFDQAALERRTHAADDEDERSTGTPAVASGGNQPFVLCDVQQDSLRAISEHNYEALRLRVPESLQ
jgi:hypothetical protein